ncbi:MAG TPA: NADH-quinone oxidoreductase subunit N [Candidatus Baltobacteraceae bacterium]|nr:NADH-quinone oxidoreductase subunit N [Candidatus Baltobacteraceae bacterium]
MFQYYMIPTFAIIALTVAYVALSVLFAYTKSKKAALVSSICLLVGVMFFSAIMASSPIEFTVANAFHAYPFSMFFIMVFSMLSILINILSYKYSSDYPVFSILFSFLFVGMFVVASANNLFSILLGLEIVSIPAAFMILHSGKKHIEAAVKFFILSAVSVAVLTFALALIFPYDLQMGLTFLAPNFQISGGYIIALALVFVIAALGFEMAVFPFNLWVPDVYEGAPSNVTALLAGINKKIAFVALIEILFVIFINYTAEFSPMLVLLSILTMFFGNLVALSQSNVKRMFAYSSISQAGYILIGLAAATTFGVEASIFQIVAHALMIIGVFAVIGWMESLNIKTVSDYTGLAGRNRFAAAALTIFMVSLAGIPPLMGFVGKFLLFSSAVSANLIPLAALGILNSFISIYYFAKLINQMYTRKNSTTITIEPYAMAVALVAIILIFLFGMYPQPLISLAHGAVVSLRS